MWAVLSRTRLFGAIALLTGSVACASTGSVPRPFPMPGRSAGPPPGSPDTEETSDSRTASIDSYALVGTALDLRGSPYRDGGSDPSGFDCSGFTQYVFGRHGVSLPREVRDQFSVGDRVRPDDLQPGDLLFFSTTSPGATHVGIAIGGDAFVHAPSSTGVVRVERLGAAYWSRRFLGVRRVI